MNFSIYDLLQVQKFCLLITTSRETKEDKIIPSQTDTFCLGTWIIPNLIPSNPVKNNSNSSNLYSVNYHLQDSILIPRWWVFTITNLPMVYPMIDVYFYVMFDTDNIMLNHLTIILNSDNKIMIVIISHDQNIESNIYLLYIKINHVVF